ncbi:MAG: hypothetical protein HC922_08400 [Leptolyngbyaceae cyanobacterium SM2_3_12]|nr:hypothetical protein [Leptolyngbyaceae cyanobacterium SM2_3_12]
MRSIPLRRLLILPFLLQLTTAVGVTGWLSMRNGQRAVTDLANQLMAEVGHQIDQHLDNYFETPVQLLRLNLDAVERGVLDPQNFEETSSVFWKQVKIFNVGYISHTSAQGEYIGAGYWDPKDPTIYMDEVKLENHHHGTGYTFDSSGQRVVALESYPYNPLAEAAYDEALAAGKMIWSSIYNWESLPEVTAISLITPMHDANQKVVAPWLWI